MASDHRVEITHLGWNVLVECFPMISEADAEELKHRLPFPISPADSHGSPPEKKHDQHASPSSSTSSSSTPTSSSGGQVGESNQKEPGEKAGEDHHPSRGHHDHSHHHHHRHHQSGEEVEEEEEKKAAPVAVHFLPEMVFDRNVIRLKYEAGDVSINFEVKQALEEWLQSPLEPLKVAASKQWEKYHVPEFATPDFDWTFSTRYRGTITRLSTGEPLAPSWTQPSELVSIDFELLKRRDPIVLYSELVLFEDELADNGVSKLSCRIRVMPTCLYILQRFWCRVDDVLFRVFDTRIFHKFGSPVLVRDFQWFENTYADLQARGQIPSDPSKLADENIMVPRLTQKLHQIEGFDLSQKTSS